jgi:hypothetical protein
MTQGARLVLDTLGEWRPCCVFESDRKVVTKEVANRGIVPFLKAIISFLRRNQHRMTCSFLN